MTRPVDGVLACRTCGITKGKDFFHQIDYKHFNLDCKLCSNEKRKLYNVVMRKMALEKYGNKCACCGEITTEFLVIDHEGGGGNAHRRENNVRSGSAFFTWLYKRNYPTGFRVLCQNCNSSLGNYGYCPHQKEVKI